MHCDKGKAARFAYAFGLGYSQFCAALIAADDAEFISSRWGVYSYAGFIGVCSAFAEYFLPGAEIEHHINSRGIHEQSGFSRGGGLPVANNAAQTSMPPRYYLAEYSYLLASSLKQINFIYFAIVAGSQWVEKLFDVEASLSTLLITLIYSALIDLPFLLATDGNASNADFRKLLRIPEAATDRIASTAARCVKPLLERRARQWLVYAGCVSNGAQEFLSLLLIINPKTLRSFHLKHPELSIFLEAAGGTVSLAPLFVIMGSIMYFEGNIARQFLRDIVRPPSLAENGAMVTANSQDDIRDVIRRPCFSVSGLLKKMLWLAPIAHAAATGMPALLFPVDYLPKSLTSMLPEIRWTGFIICVSIELVGNIHSQYTECHQRFQEDEQRVEQYLAQQEAINTQQAHAADTTIVIADAHEEISSASNGGLFASPPPNVAPSEGTLPEPLLPSATPPNGPQGTPPQSAPSSPLLIPHLALGGKAFTAKENASERHHHSQPPQDRAETARHKNGRPHSSHSPRERGAFTREGEPEQRPHSEPPQHRAEETTDHENRRSHSFSPRAGA